MHCMWWSYQDVAEAKERVQREIAKRKKKGERFDALLPQTTGKKLCTTFWGQAWCRNLETYQEYESRLPRGRSYFRQGNVYNLVIESEKVTAVVAGSELYDTQVFIQPLKTSKWQDIVEKCEGQVGSMLGPTDAALRRERRSTENLMSLAEISGWSYGVVVRLMQEHARREARASGARSHESKPMQIGDWEALYREVFGS